MSSLGKYICILFLLILFPGCRQGASQSSSAEEIQVEIQVSPAIDLFGLISRLAGINQYTEVMLPEFITELENYFGHLSDHPSIAFARECNARHQINGDAPMALAVYVGPPPDWELRMDLSNIPDAFDPRWDSALINEYLEHARVFARESHFVEFFQGQKQFQEHAREKLAAMLEGEGLFSWYMDYFGYYPEKVTAYLCLLNGTCSYGYPVFCPDGSLEFVSLMGGRFPDRNGVPSYPKDWFIPIIVHEYAHSYINPLIKSKPEEFKSMGEALLRTQQAKMIERGYNVWNVMLQEYLVRAITVRYLEQNNGRHKARENIRRDIRDGFAEIQGLVTLVEDYENLRDTYPTIESFLPQVKTYFEEYLGQ